MSPGFQEKRIPVFSEEWDHMPDHIRIPFAFPSPSCILR